MYDFHQKKVCRNKNACVFVSGSDALFKLMRFAKAFDSISKRKNNLFFWDVCYSGSCLCADQQCWANSFLNGLCRK
jgi:hypothetical protein